MRFCWLLYFSEHQSNDNLAICVQNMEYVVSARILMAPLPVLCSFAVPFRFFVVVVSARALIVTCAVLQEQPLTRTAEVEHEVHRYVQTKL